MGTGLERDEQRGSTGGIAGSLQRHHLGVRGSGPLVPSLTDHMAGFQQDGADPRVRMCALVGCELEGSAQGVQGKPTP